MMVEVNIIDQRALEQVIDFADWTSVAEVMKDLDQSSFEVGGFKVGDTEYKDVKNSFGDGEYEIVKEISSNTGSVLFVNVDGKELVIKTDLNQEHGYLNFEEKWIRLWSLAAECNMSQTQDTNSHLGVLGIERVGDKGVVFRPLDEVGQENVEPGLVMTKYGETLLDVAETDIDRFFGFIPRAVEGIVNMQQPLPDGYNAEALGSVGAFVDNFKNGNLQNLLRDNQVLSDGKTVAKMWKNIWEIGQKAIERHRDILDNREVTVRHGDNGLCNAGISENGLSMGWFDPVMLSFIYIRDDEGKILEWGAALWNIDNIERSLGAATVDLRMLEDINKSLGEHNLAERYTVARQSMIYYMARQMDWQITPGEQIDNGSLGEDKMLLIKFGEAYWAQVRAEIILRKSRELREGGLDDEADKYLNWYEALTNICFKTFKELNNTDPVSIS